jgi:hypothetical protein
VPSRTSVWRFQTKKNEERNAASDGRRPPGRTQDEEATSQHLEEATSQHLEEATSQHLEEGTFQHLEEGTFQHLEEGTFQHLEEEGTHRDPT